MNKRKKEPMTTTKKDWEIEWGKIRDTGVDEKMSQFYDRIEKFIRNLLDTQKKELREKVEYLTTYSPQPIGGLSTVEYIKKSDILHLLKEE